MNSGLFVPIHWKDLAPNNMWREQICRRARKGHVIPAEYSKISLVGCSQCIECGSACSAITRRRSLGLYSPLALCVDGRITFPEGVALAEPHPLTSTQAGADLDVNLREQGVLLRIDVCLVNELIIRSTGIEGTRSRGCERAVNLNAVAVGPSSVRVILLRVQYTGTSIVKRVMNVLGTTSL